MRPRYSLLALAVFLFAVLLTACGAGIANDPLNGTAWMLASIDNIPPLKGPSLTAEFKDGQVGGSSGCNSYGGKYEIKGDRIATDSIAMTLMACADSGVMEQEQTFLGYLQDARTFKLHEGRLLIFRSDGKSLTFIPVI